MGWRNDWLWILPPSSTVEDVERRHGRSLWHRLLDRWRGNIR